MPLDSKTLAQLQNATLKELKLFCVDLDLRNKREEMQAQIAAVLPFISSCYHLKKFEISFVDLGILPDVISLLKHMPNLHILIISETDLADDQANILIQTVGELHLLTDLQFNNKITERTSSSTQYNDNRLCGLASMLKSLPYIGDIGFGQHKNYNVKYFETLLESISQYTCNVWGLPLVQIILPLEARAVVNKIVSANEQNSANIKALYNLESHFEQQITASLFNISVLTEALVNQEISMTQICDVMKRYLEVRQIFVHPSFIDGILNDGHLIQKHIITDVNILEVQEICISDFIKKIYTLDDVLDKNFMLRLYTYKPLLNAVKNGHIDPSQIHSYIKENMDAMCKSNFNFDAMRDALIEDALLTRATSEQLLETLKAELLSKGTSEQLLQKIKEAECLKGVSVETLQEHNFYGFDIVKMLIENQQFSDALFLIEYGNNYTQYFNSLVALPFPAQEEAIKDYMALLCSIISEIPDLSSNSYYLDHAIEHRKTSIVESLILSKAYIAEKVALDSEPASFPKKGNVLEDVEILELIGQYQFEKALDQIE